MLALQLACQAAQRVSQLAERVAARLGFHPLHECDCS